MKLRNRGASAAHFAVYPYAGELERPLQVDVRHAHEERLDLAGDVYRLGVQGPNRFWCELAGQRSGDAARVDVRLGAAVFWRLLVLDLENHGDGPVTLRLKALAFGDRERSVRLRPGRSRTIEWETDRGWYDVEVTARDDHAFRRRFTGRVETARAGVTP